MRTKNEGFFVSSLLSLSCSSYIFYEKHNNNNNNKHTHNNHESHHHEKKDVSLSQFKNIKKKRDSNFDDRSGTSHSESLRAIRSGTSPITHVLLLKHLHVRQEQVVEFSSSEKIEANQGSASRRNWLGKLMNLREEKAKPNMYVDSIY